MVYDQNTTHPNDPGPVPKVVEPAEPGQQTTIVVSPRSVVVVRENYRGSGLTGLTLAIGQDQLTVALHAPAGDALIEALTEAVPVPYELVREAP